MTFNKEGVISGKRKSAVANVRFLLPGNGNIIVNNRFLEDYFQYNPRLIKIIQSPLSLLELEGHYDIIVNCEGGGIKGQSEAIRLAISRHLSKVMDLESKILLRKNGFLTCNSLCKERRKYGLKKARKASQFSKR
uniref:Small ribosomal subunit protein uS9c n=1 Tax=Trachelomonas volvocina TaxID=103340 RepID=A0A0G3VP33_9EUGL|nr:ribosomal protein S9 [Trachelomonas volvocina]AKL82416.1 ribosomal protein S9 [Trachelomonas volvocina]